jgi:hypothetical protein
MPETHAGMPARTRTNDAYIRGEDDHAGHQQSIVTVSGHSLRS